MPHNLYMYKSNKTKVAIVPTNRKPPNPLPELREPVKTTKTLSFDTRMWLHQTLYSTLWAEVGVGQCHIWLLRKDGIYDTFSDHGKSSAKP